MCQKWRARQVTEIASICCQPRSSELQIEVETNGTLAPEPALAARVDQWNVSPKLAHAGDPEARRIRIDALLALRDTGRAFLKFVLQSEQDWHETEALIERLGWPRASGLDAV